MAGIKEFFSKKAIDDIKIVDQAFKDILKSANNLKALERIFQGITEETKKSKENTTKLNEAQKETLRVSQGLQKTIAQLNNVRSEENKKLIDQKQKLLSVNKELRENSKQNAIVQKRLEAGIKDAKALSGAYDKLNKELVENRKLAKDIGVVYGTNSKQFKSAQANVAQLDNRLKNLDSSLGLNQRRVGAYRDSLNGLPGPLGRFGQGLSILGQGLKFLVSPLGLATGAILGIGAVFVAALKNAVQFQKANAELAGVLGKTRDEVAGLRENAKLLGSTTSFTAQEVTKLQTEFAKLGFVESDILDITKSTIDLAVVSGKAAGEVAAFVGATIRQFGLAASDATRVADVAAKAFSSSALDFEKLSTGLAIVGPIASSAGKDIEETTALLGILADRGLDASSSATALRNIFLEVSKQGISLDAALGQIATAADKNKVALDLFGKRAAVAGLILAESGNQVEKLQFKLRNAGGTAEKVANEQLNTLTGKTTLLKSAWDGFLLSLEDGEGVLSKFAQGVVEIATGFLELITTTTTLEEKLDRVSQEYAFQTSKANDLFDRTKALNLEDEKRAELIGEINKQYVDLIPNLLDEDASLEEIEKAQNAVNSALEENILLKNKQILTTEASEKKLQEEKEAFQRFTEIAKGQGIKSVTQISDAFIKLRTTLSTTNGATRDGIIAQNEAIQSIRDELNITNKSSAANKNLGAVVGRLALSNRDYKDSITEINAELKALGLTQKTENKESERQNKIQELNKKTLGELRTLKFDDQKIEDARLKRIVELVDQEKKQGEEAEKAAQKASQARAKALKIELEAFKINNKSKIDSNTQFTDKIVEDEKDRLNKIALEEIKVAEQRGKLLNQTEQEIALEKLKITTKLTEEIEKLDEQIVKQAEANGKKTAGAEKAAANLRLQVRRKALKSGFDEELIFQKQLLASGEINRNEFAKKEKEINFQKNQAIIEDDIRIAEKQIELLEEGSAQKLKLEQDLAEQKIALSDLVAEKEIENAEKVAERQKEIRDAVQELAVEAVNTFFEIQKNSRDKELLDLQVQKDQELKAVKGNKDAEAKVNEEFAKKEAAIKKKQAIADRNQALFNIAISTAQNIVEAFPNPILIAIAAALGLAQAAVVASRPIPEFKKGVKDFSGGLAYVGDGGKREIVGTPDGSMFITPDTRTLVNLPAGSDVYPDASKFLSDSSKYTNNKGSFTDLIPLQNEIKNVKKSIDNKPVPEIHITAGGMHFITKTSTTRKIHKDRYFRN